MDIYWGINLYFYKTGLLFSPSLALVINALERGEEVVPFLMLLGSTSHHSSSFALRTELNGSSSDIWRAMGSPEMV